MGITFCDHRLYDTLKQEAKTTNDSKTKRILKEVVSAQGNLLKAWYHLSEYKFDVPPEAHESPEHFVAKNVIVKKLEAQFPKLEFIHPFSGLSGCRPDVLIKTNEEYIILEAETAPTKCAEKIKNFKLSFDELKNVTEQEENPTLLTLKIQLDNNQVIKILFALTRKPNSLTLENIKNELTTDPRIEIKIFSYKWSLLKQRRFFSVRRAVPFSLQISRFMFTPRVFDRSLFGSHPARLALKKLVTTSFY